MGFSCYTDYGCMPYDDLGPPESWRDRAIREQGEQIGRLQCRIEELERSLSDALRQLSQQAEIIERLQSRPWRG